MFNWNKANSGRDKILQVLVSNYSSQLLMNVLIFACLRCALKKEGLLKNTYVASLH